MQLTARPTNFPIPFANNAGPGYIDAIPEASQIGITPGKASLHDGFPPVTFLPDTAGGTPPWGADFNGILYEITQALQWMQAGGAPIFDAVFASQIGGYPQGAILSAASGFGFWECTTDNNSNNPDTGGAGWRPFAFAGILTLTVTGADVTLTPPQYANQTIICAGALTGNRTVNFPAQPGIWIFTNYCTGSYNLSVNLAGGTPLVIAQGVSALIYWDGTNIVGGSPIAGKAAASAPTANTVMIRDSFGRSQVAAPSASSDITTKDYVDTSVASVAAEVPGVGQSWSAPSRAINTPYHNAGTRPIMVNCNVVDSSGGTAHALCDATTTPTQECARANYSSGFDGGLSFIVPPGYYYKVTGTTGGASIGNWYELS